MATYIVDQLVTLLTFRRDDAALDQVQKKVQGYQRTLNGLAQKTAIAGTALTGAAAVVGRTLLGFDRSLNALTATFGNATEAQLERLQAQAREFGATTSKSATDAVRAQLELARAGLDVEEVLAALPGVLNLAIAGELEMGQAASLVTNQLNAFGLSAVDANRVVDVLASTATNANTTVAQLGPAFRQVAPLASAMGLTIETTAAALGTLRNQGLAAEQAGTALRGILVRFADADPPASMIEGFRSLGLNFADLRAQMEQGDLVGVLRQMQAAGLDAGRATQIFGTEAVAAVLALTANAGDLQAFAGNLDDVDGAANRMRETMESGLPGAFDSFKSSAEAAQLALGESGLGGTIGFVLDKATAFLRWFAEAPGPVRTFTTVVLAAGPVLLGLGIGLRAVSFALGGYSTALTVASATSGFFASTNLILRIQLAALTVQQWLTTAATWALTTARTVGTAGVWGAIAGSIAFRAVLIAGTVATWAATAAQWALNAAMYANPIGLIVLAVVAAVAALVGLGYVIWRFRDAIVGAIGSAIDWVRDNWPLLLAIITGPIGLAIYAVWRFRDQIIGAFRSAWDWITNAAGGVYNAIVWPFEQAWRRIKGIWDSITGVFGGDELAVNARAPGSPPRPPGTGPASTPGAIPVFHQGGVMPGTGPGLAVLRPGEIVLPPALSSLLMGVAQYGPQLAAASAGGGAAGLLPSVPPPAPAINNVSRTFNVTVGDINFEVHTDSIASESDMEELVSTVPSWMRSQLENLAADLDSDILR